VASTRGWVGHPDAAGLEPLTFHSLRATYATLTADAGLPITKLSALLGHADAATTAIYIRPESSRAAVDPLQSSVAPFRHRRSKTTTGVRINE
jgi:integrase